MRLALVLILLAGQAQALSCMRPTVADSFHAANERPEDIYLLKGQLRFDETLLPTTDHSVQDQSPPAIPAQFSGFALNRDGFTTPMDRAITLQPLCFGPWCGSAVAGQDSILFARVDGPNLIVEANPCGTQIFYDPTADMEATATACINGRCPPPSWQ